ncbi:cytochrome c [Iamia sp. SCSIO 61187]|uniref:c-type cytochrome n=1 Tax=Iamia sp. SCSIO 61187 TaxID=2722752 RepID=UPI001C62DC73|nr:cytochrome c [Iamia sp. SCSIO 61187]QYG91858.1 cytochrome c [Iamia sp. SCSIO 61187]
MAALAVAGVAQVGAACGDDGGRTEAGPTTGAELYQRSCASCHGRDLRGTDLGPSHLSQVYAPDHHPDASFRAAIEEGSTAHHWDFGDMPPIRGLSDDEIDLVIAYVREQQEIHGLEPYPPG